MKTFFLFLIFALNLQYVFASPRESSGEVLLDYVTELERTVDELLHKIVFLENELDKLKEQQAQTKQPPEGNLNIMPSINDQTSENINNLKDQDIVTSSVSCPPHYANPVQDYSQQLIKAEQELNRLRNELESCRNAIKTVAREDLNGDILTEGKPAPAEPPVDHEILKLRGVLVSELRRFKEMVLSSNASRAYAKEQQENFLKRLDEIEAELKTASTYKHLADLKGKISLLKREFNKGFRSN
ncbi:MAG: hypothetical protein QXL01_07155 [Thermoplasmatales archaeon]